MCSLFQIQPHDRDTRHFQFKVRFSYSFPNYLWKYTQLLLNLSRDLQRQPQFETCYMICLFFQHVESLHSDRGNSTYVPCAMTPHGSHQAELLPSPLHAQQTSLIVHRPLHNAPLLPQYLDSPQYLAVPVQPVIGFQQIQTLPPSPDLGILITPVQVQMQEQVRYFKQLFCIFYMKVLTMHWRRTYLAT